MQKVPIEPQHGELYRSLYRRRYRKSLKSRAVCLKILSDAAPFEGGVLLKKQRTVCKKTSAIKLFIDGGIRGIFAFLLKIIIKYVILYTRERFI